MKTTSIYITREGQSFGPYSPDQARQMLASGELTPGDSAWVEGTEDWMPLQELLAGLGASPPVPAKKGGMAIKVMALLALVGVGVAGVWMFKGDVESTDEDGKEAKAAAPAAPKAPEAPPRIPKKLPEDNGLEKIARVAEFNSAFFGANKGLVVLSEGPAKGLLAGADLLVCRNGQVLGRMKVARVQGGKSVAIALNPLDSTTLRIGDEIAFDITSDGGAVPVEKMVLANHLPDKPAMMATVQLGKLMGLLQSHSSMQNAFHGLSGVPLLGEIMGEFQRGNIQFSKTNVSYMWGREITSSTGGDPDVMFCLVLAMDRGLGDLESILVNVMEMSNQPAITEKRQGYSVLKNRNFPAASFAFGNGRFVLTGIIDSSMKQLRPERMAGSNGARLLSLQDEALELAFNGRKEPNGMAALSDFSEHTNDVGLFVDISQMSDVAEGDDPAQQATMDLLKDSPLAIGIDFEEGSVSLNLTAYNAALKPIQNRLDEALLKSLPADSVAVAGVSVGSDSFQELYENTLIPLLKKAVPAQEDLAMFNVAVAAIKSASGKSIPEMLGMLNGSIVLGWAGIESQNTSSQPHPKGVLGLSCNSPEAAGDLLKAIQSAGGVALLKELGLNVLSKDNQILICSESYRQSLTEGGKLNDGTDSRLKLLTSNNLALVAKADDIIKIASVLELPKEFLDQLAVVNQLSFTGNFLEGKRVFELNCTFKEDHKNGLLTLAELVVPAGSVPGGRLMGNGTGFFITQDGLLVTNYHVVENGAAFSVVVDSGEELPAELIKLNRENDLALLRVKGDFKPLPVRNSTESELGDPVLTMGFPAINVQGRDPKLTEGMISSLKGMRDDRRFFQISVPVQPGNSGGALVDEFGNVVGVVTARLNDAALGGGFIPQNVNYAVKSSVLIDFLKNVPPLAGKLPTPFDDGNGRSKREVIRAVKDAKVLVLVYGR